jgi:sulfane dehydrogenase subunit SoxC
MPTQPDPQQPSAVEDRQQLTRRSWLSRAAAVPVAAAAGPALAQAGGRNLPPSHAEWTTRQGGPFLNPPYGQPSPFEKGVVRALPAGNNPFPTATRSPLQKMHGILTPNGLFFERHHAGVPAIDPAQHRLMVHGMVDRPLTFTMDDLVRFPSASRICFLECSGNSGGQFKSAGGRTAQDIHGLLSCTEWTGIMLSTVLAEAGIKPGAKWILAEGADAAAMTRSVPIEIALDDAMLVYGQGGEMLRPEQGYPLRLFLPGIEGNMNIKWLRRIKVGAEPFHTREETSKYTDLMRDGRSEQFSFLMDAKSVILSPSGGEKIQPGAFAEISGIAWTGRGRIRAVDVSADGGRTWRQATLQEPVLSKALTRFRLPWRWDGSPVVLQSRAMDETGYVQPTRKQLLDVRGPEFFYHYNAIQSWRVAATGEVTNVHA